MADKKLPESHPQRRKPRKRPKRITPNKPTGIPCVDSTTYEERLDTVATLYGFAGPDRRGPDGIDPFWAQLVLDLVTAQRAITNWLRSKVADGIAYVAVKLMRLADKVGGPNA